VPSPREWVNGLTAIGLVFVCGLAARGYSASHGAAVTASPRKPEQAAAVVNESGRRVIATGEGSRSDRCDVHGTANGKPFVFEIDTGAGDMALFSSSHLAKLSINPKTLHYEEFWPGTRYGKIATTNLREIVIGGVVWNKPEVRIYSNWKFSFGGDEGDETPLLGLPALNAKGVNVEFDGGMCRLTVARKAIG
jgi:hypothetical protein